MIPAVKSMAGEISPEMPRSVIAQLTKVAKVGQRSPLPLISPLSFPFPFVMLLLLAELLINARLDDSPFLSPILSRMFSCFP